MNEKYLAKIIAKDSHGLKLISACCFEAKVKIKELKYLKKNPQIIYKVLRNAEKTWYGRLARCWCQNLCVWRLISLGQDFDF